MSENVELTTGDDADVASEDAAIIQEGAADGDEGVITMADAGLEGARLGLGEGADDLDGDSVLDRSETPHPDADVVDETLELGTQTTEEEPPIPEESHREWDPERAKANEEAARLRKENEELRAKLADDVTEEVVSLDLEAEAGLEEQLEPLEKLEPLEPLDEFASEEERVERSNELTRRNNLLAKRQVLVEERTARREGRVALAASTMEIARAIDPTKATEIAQEVKVRFTKELKARGFTKANLPTTQHSQDILRLVGAELRAERGTTTVRPKPKPSGATGRGRQPVTSKKPSGFATDAEARAEIAASFDEKYRKRQST